MINFRLSTAHSLLSLLRLETQELESRARQIETAGGFSSLIERVDDKSREHLVYIGEQFSETFGCFGSDAVNDRVRAIVGQLSRDYAPTWREQYHKAKSLLDAAEAELTRQYFFHYPRDKGILVINVAEDCAAVISAFPSAERDIISAVDCYALGHHHASIYHFMMVLEKGMPALANRLKVTVRKHRPTWRDMTDDIRREIDRRRARLSSNPRGASPLSPSAARKEHALLGLCGEAALELKFFEHAWRNHIAHGRAEYDENDAKKVMEHTRVFMGVLATKLNIKERIR